jgi:hypothetical protein
MNLLEQQVLRRIAEDLQNPDVFTDDPYGLALVRGSLNDAIMELCLATGAYTRTYHLGLFYGKQFYRMAPQHDFIAFIKTCWDREHHYRLIRTDISNLNQQDPFWMRRSGRPLQYLTAGFDYIGLYPVPSEEGKILELICACVPKAYATDKDPIKVRDQFQQAAVEFATGEFFASRGDAKRALEHHQRYIEIAGIMSGTPEYAERASAMQNPNAKVGEWNYRSGQ